MLSYRAQHHRYVFSGLVEKQRMMEQAVPKGADYPDIPGSVDAAQNNMQAHGLAISCYLVCSPGDSRLTCPPVNVNGNMSSSPLRRPKCSSIIRIVVLAVLTMHH